MQTKMRVMEARIEKLEAARDVVNSASGEKAEWQWWGAKKTSAVKSKDEPGSGDERALLRCDGQMRGLLAELRALNAANAASELTQ